MIPRAAQDRARALLWLALLALTLLCPAAHAQRAVEGLAVLVDADGGETIASVAAPARAHEFAAVGDNLSAGYSRKVRWLRFTVQAPPGSGGKLWLEVQPPYVDDLRLFVPDPSQPDGFAMRRAGDLQPFAARELPYRGFVFRLALPDTQAHTLYLRLETSSSSVLSLRQWSPDAFVAAAAREYIALGLFYGILASMMVATLWHGRWRRDPQFRHFLLFLGATVVFLLGSNGLVSQFLLPARPHLASAWTSIGLLLLTASGARFYQLVLEIDHRLPRLRTAFRAMQCMALVAVPVAIAGYFTEMVRIVMPCALLLALLCLGRSLLLAAHGRLGSHFLALAYAIGLLGSSSGILVVLGVLPGDLWLIHGAQLGSLGTLTAFGLALRARLRGESREREAALERAAAAETLARQEQIARAQQRQFLSMLSHELRTPLTTIQTAIGALKRLSGADTPEHLARHGRIQRSIERIGRLLNQLLTSDRVDEGMVSVQCRDIDVAALCRELIDGMERGGRIDLGGETTLRASVDPALLRIAMQNLLDNALKYSPDDTRVDLHLSTAADTVTLSVRDRGAGIAPALRPALFARYVRGEAHAHIPGSGLGLYIVRCIALAHGGGVEVGDAAGGGSRFDLRLRRAPT